jgi:hypothetical protein
MIEGRRARRLRGSAHRREYRDLQSAQASNRRYVTMATIVQRHDTIAPAPLPDLEAPVTDVHPGGARRRAVVAAVAGYAFDGVDIMVLALALPLISRTGTSRWSRAA